jgi:NAD(P)-dependent dehydrogenase (short-subunit alcohol dehydrogenase family)
MLKQSNPEHSSSLNADYFFARASLRRFGKSEEIADVAVFLACAESSR